MNLYDITRHKTRPELDMAARVLALALAASGVPREHCEIDSGVFRALQHPGAVDTRRVPIRRLLLSAAGEDSVDFWNNRSGERLANVCPSCGALMLYARHLWGPPFGRGTRLGAYIGATFYAPDTADRMPGCYSADVPWRHDNDPAAWAASHPAESTLWPMPNLFWLHADGSGACGLCGEHAPAITHYSCQGGSQTWLPTRHPCVSYDSDAQNVRGATDPYLIQARALHARPQILESTPLGAAVRWFSTRGSQAVIAQMHEGRFPWNPDIPPEIFVIYSETSKTVVPKAVGVALYGKPSIGIERKRQMEQWGGSTLRAEVVAAVQHVLDPFMRSALDGELTPQDFYHAAWYNGIRIFNTYAEHKNIVTHGKQYADGLQWFKTLMAKLRRELGIPSPFDVWGQKIAVARENGRRGGRRQTIPWSTYDARILAGENVASLADEIGCSRQMVYNRKFQLKKVT